ncbi:MAG TPA: hypothetical protein VMR89_02740 [Actinomycetota bacterium]|nr:hypothetical protein [Actinomycetota bacterium]
MTSPANPAPRRRRSRTPDTTVPATTTSNTYSAAEALAEALDSTFRIIEGFLDRWTIDDLEEELRRPEWEGSWVHTRGWVIQRVFTHDVWHAAEMNESLGNAGLPQIDLWA